MIDKRKNVVFDDTPINATNVVEDIYSREPGNISVRTVEM